MMREFLDKFEKWQRNRKIRNGNFYEIYKGTNVYDNEDTTAAFKILKGKYKDVVFSIGKITIGETLPDGSAKAQFDVSIIEQPSKFTHDLTLDDKFSKISGDILLVVLEDAIKLADERMNSLEQELRESKDEFEQDRTDYFEEPVQKRTVRKKNPSVSKKRILSGKNRKDRIR